MKDAIDRIQKELTQIKIACATADIDDWLYDHLRNIQEAINDYRNSWAKPSEQDPFN